MTERRLGQRLRAACVLLCALVLAGCMNHSLQDRIESLHFGDEKPKLVEPRPRPAARARLLPRTPPKPRADEESPRAADAESGASRISRWRAVPKDHKRTPYVNSPEWHKEQADAAEKDRVLDRTIRGICRGC